MHSRTLAGTRRVWLTCVIGVCLIGLLAGAGVAAGAITGVKVANQPDRIVIDVSGDSALSLTPLTSARGNYLGFQIPARLATKGRLVGVHSGRICNVRYSNFRARPALTRVIVNTTGHLSYSTDWSPDRRRVEITVMKHGFTKTAVKPTRTARVISAVSGVMTSVAPEAPISSAASPVTGWEAPTASAPTITALISAIESVRVPARSIMMKTPPAGQMTAREPLVSRLDGAETRISNPVTKTMGMTEAASRLEPVAEQATERAMAYAPAPVVNVAAAAQVVTSAVEERKVSLNFLGADINDVLKALAVQSGHNIVASKDVTGNVTVSLTNVTVEEALDYVAKLSGYGYTKDNDTYLVAAKDKLSSLTGSGSAQAAVEIVPVSYASADDLVALIKAQFQEVQVSKVGKAKSQTPGGPQADEGLGSSSGIKLILNGPADIVAEAKQMILTVDESLKTQMLGESTELYRVKYVNIVELAKTLRGMIPGISVGYAPSEGFDLKAPTAIAMSASGAAVQQYGAGGAAGASAQATQSSAPKAPVAVDATGVALNLQEENTKSRCLIIVGRQTDVQKALELARTVDVKSPQIKIDAKITSLNDSAEKKLGLTWDWGTIGFAEVSTNAWKRQPIDIAGTLSALFTDGSGTLLASPSLVCLENKPGVFFVGDEVTYIVRIEQTSQGQNITTDTKQVGVQLRVVGTANPDGFITLNLHPEVSVLKLNYTQGITTPVVTRRFTDHIVRVKSGDTFIIGGLIRDEDLREMKKVPFLGDIPFLGNAFRHMQKSNGHSQVVMFITASILAD